MFALVTGGGGFLGSHIVEQLIARGGRVRVFCRGAYPLLEEWGVETVQGDIRDAKAVSSACVGIDTVFHVAAVPGVWGSWSMFHGINTVGTENVIAGCREHGAGRLVYTSSPSVIYDGQPHENVDESISYPPDDSYLCDYPHSKALAEKAVLAANGDDLATASLRPHLIWGPRDNHLIPRLIQRAKSGRLRRVGDGTNLISMSYVENVAAAHTQAADALTPNSTVAGQAYFINEPEPVNLWDWIDLLLERAGLSPVRKTISARAAHRIGRALELFYSLMRLRGEPPMTRFVASQLSSSHYYDVSKAVRDFGYAPKVSVEEGLSKIESELHRLASRSQGRE
jgi:nucleoside-diphosphate-sugar epimerase